ncbi:helix-turn-helix domain-containing protein [Spirosoma foliorum]|uniref:Helix-turn-helix transcriptional regulator n=1 Tax=Spirosoma foliorum TaxID=2710596 RepID=A0A7G5GUE7_9BACT|nr:AraC family transcriptional regulator [Spirosoma foliorum]QMW02489.1 helix-turn-helix transcriptional regulator [Spirosoma foliorum]
MYPAKVSEEWHSHEQAHVTFMLRGGNRERRTKTEQQLGAGQLVFYHSRELHRNDHTLFPSRNLNLEIEPIFFQTYHLTEHQVDQAVKTGRLTGLEVTRLFYEALHPDPSAADSLHLLLLGYLQKTKGPGRPVGLLRAREWLHDNWYTWPTLAELAAVAGLHPVTLSKYFPQYFGYSLSQYMRRLKVQQALPLVSASRYSLSEIAYRCGFADQSHFIRCFKEQTGMPPSSFKRF